MKLPLAQKGKIQAPPVLKAPFKGMSVEIASWPEVIAATHWHLTRPTEIDGADFYVGKDELGHIHLDGELHIPFDRVLSGPLVKANLARRFAYGDSYGGWAEASVRSRLDADHGLWLFKLNYDHITGTAIKTLLERIAAASEKRESTIA